MTTEVIIKNKSGLVMAADSAVTISNIFTPGKFIIQPINYFHYQNMILLAF